MAARASQPLLAKTRLLQRTRLTSRGLSIPQLRYQGSLTSAAGQIATFAVLAVPTLKVALGGAIWLCSVSIAFGYGYGLGQGDAGLAQTTWREAMYRKWLATKHAKSKRRNAKVDEDGSQEGRAEPANQVHEPDKGVSESVYGRWLAGRERGRGKGRRKKSNIAVRSSIENAETVEQDKPSSPSNPERLLSAQSAEANKKE